MPRTPAHSTLQERQVRASGVAIQTVSAGAAELPCILFLHGWPQCSAAFERVMTALRYDAHVVAIDLPGIGGSPTPPASNDKHARAVGL
jgi:pimeloyl-ACP methyl ester carboxylesterase